MSVNLFPNILDLVQSVLVFIIEFSYVVFVSEVQVKQNYKEMNCSCGIIPIRKAIMDMPKSSNR